MGFLPIAPQLRTGSSLSRHRSKRSDRGDLRDTPFLLHDYEKEGEDPPVTDEGSETLPYVMDGTAGSYPLHRFRLNNFEKTLARGVPRRTAGEPLTTLGEISHSTAGASMSKLPVNCESDKTKIQQNGL